MHSECSMLLDTALRGSLSRRALSHHSGGSVLAHCLNRAVLCAEQKHSMQ